jgi:two-component system LytT family response regulator
MKNITLNKLIIHTQNHVRFVNQHDIIYCKSDNCYSNIYLGDEDHLIICVPLTKFARRLDNRIFLRVSQSYIVNTNYIKSIDKKRKIILMMNKSQVPFTIRIKELLELISRDVLNHTTFLTEEGINL